MLSKAIVTEAGMDSGYLLLWILIFVGGPLALYGLHRLCLCLEGHGWLYYKHKKPCSSPASCFVALQQVLEPPIHHVLQVQEEKRYHAQQDVPRQHELTPAEGCTNRASDPERTLDETAQRHEDHKCDETTHFSWDGSCPCYRFADARSGARRALGCRGRGP
jgi:hypothetical protein